IIYVKTQLSHHHNNISIIHTCMHNVQFYYNCILIINIYIHTNACLDPPIKKMILNSLLIHCQ
uniref:Uncharacterized protein n=1 Tax=Amphimedon queenslandica TaxID=400682 RepID=A0A1X7VU99_AMPQE